MYHALYPTEKPKFDILIILTILISNYIVSEVALLAVRPQAQRGKSGVSPALSRNGKRINCE